HPALHAFPTRRSSDLFIFNPALPADTAIANGMQALLAAAPSPIRSCLRRQFGGIAARNSCTGPWQASLDLQVNWRPEWFGLDRRDRKSTRLNSSHVAI